MLDGELVAFGETVRPDFHQLPSKRAPVMAFLFDVLEIDGGDQRARPSSERRCQQKRPQSCAILAWNSLFSESIPCGPRDQLFVNS